MISANSAKNSDSGFDLIRSFSKFSESPDAMYFDNKIHQYPQGFPLYWFWVCDTLIILSGSFSRANA